MRSAKRMLSIFSLILIGCVSFSGYVHAGFKICIMQEKKDSAAKLRPLLNYFSKNGIDTSFIAARSYSDAAKMFSNGEVDGMFSGSGIAGCMIIKGLADPIVRPVSNEGWSTYWALVLAPKGSPRFTQNPDYFRNKRVIFCSLASSGEFFYQAIQRKAKIDVTIMKASSHGAAIDALSRGRADIAIVKNRVWDKVKDKYENIIRVGEDPGENPDGTLIVSNNSDPAVVEKIAALLIGLKDDDSPEANAVKEKLKIIGYIKTTINDFRFTIPLLKKAGVDRHFNFAFK